jgi:hypothetical protein
MPAKSGLDIRKQLHKTKAAKQTEGPNVAARCFNTPASCLEGVGLTSRLECKLLCLTHL